MELPPLEAVLRYPIEVWASAGEAFIKPEKVEADQKQMKNYRKLIADISFELQKEKHRLRQMQGLDSEGVVVCTNRLFID